MEKTAVPMSERFPLLAMDRENLVTVPETGPSCPVDPEGPKPFRAEVIASSDMHWSTNALRFPTKDEALSYAANLGRRWLLVTHYRAVDATVPENQPYEPGSEDGTF